MKYNDEYRNGDDNRYDGKYSDRHVSKYNNEYDSGYDSKHKYDDIIRLPHHISEKHPQMPLQNRAAQFSPFAALTGHNEAIQETARLTDSFIELDEDKKERLDEQLQFIRENLEQKPECEITYFRPDEKKKGGTYGTVRGRIKKIDEYAHRIIFTDGTTLPIERIFSITGELFRNMEMSDL